MSICRKYRFVLWDALLAAAGFVKTLPVRRQFSVPCMYVRNPRDEACIPCVQGKSPMQEAACAGHVLCVRALLNDGADVDMRSNVRHLSDPRHLSQR